MATIETTIIDTLYDADYWAYGEGWDEIKRDMAEGYINSYDYDTDEEYEKAIREEMDAMDAYSVWEEVAIRQELDLDYAIDEVEERVGDGDDGLLVMGTLGLWNGRCAAGCRAISFRDAISKIMGRDCEIESITVEDGNVHVTATHHDGRNSFTVRALTEAGSDALHDWECDYGPLAGKFEGDAHKALMASDEWTHSIAPKYDA